MVSVVYVKFPPVFSTVEEEEADAGSRSGLLVELVAPVLFAL